MDRSVIRRRTQVALQTISDVAAHIAGALDIGDEASEILNINHLPKANNDPAIRSVYQLESFASLLQLIANKIGDDRGYTDTANHTASQPDTESDTESNTTSDSQPDSTDASGTGQESTEQDTGSGSGTDRGTSRGTSGSAVESEPGRSGRGVEQGETGSSTANRIDDVLLESGLTRSQIDALVEAGFSSLYIIRESSDEELERVKGIGPYTVGVLRSLSR